MMLLQLLVGALVSVIAIVIHAFATILAISVARRAARLPKASPRLHLMGVMVATVLVLMLAHTGEIVVWSLSYAVVGAAPAGSDLLYFAFVNYTTLGYGDVTPVKTWQLLGPMAAMNGILMFGWSTAVLFEVLLKTIDRLGSIATPGTLFSAEDRG
jgi:Ion channel